MLGVRVERGRLNVKSRLKHVEAHDFVIFEMVVTLSIIYIVHHLEYDDPD
jgi:hypothetical protein